MPDPLLYDTVTLRHFGVCQQLSLCEVLHSELPFPRWTEEVKSEIERAAAIGIAGCSDILSQHWLGAPIIPAPSDQAGIVKMWIALNGSRLPPIEHAGEAQSIYFAEQLGGVFATDDNAAYAFAERRLGKGRVVDTVDILRAAVAGGQIAAADAVNAANNIRKAGRHLRRVHPLTLTDSHFH